MTSRYDTIIIGSGVSGMTAGIILAKEREKVLVVEQNDRPGGLTQTFKRRDLVFPTGVHRLGALNPGQPLWYYFNYLGLMDSLQLTSLSSDGFESYYFPDRCFKVPQGHGAYRAKLISEFPEKEAGIRRYFHDMAELVNGIELYHPGKTGSLDHSNRFTSSMDDYFKTSNIGGELKGILSANNPLFGMSSAECPVLTHFLIADCYLNSSFRIDETATPFAGALTACLESEGGGIRVKSRVEKILVEDRIAKGVALRSGEILVADRVIHSGHPALVPALCPPESFRPVYHKRLAAAKNTPGVFGVALKWRENHCPVIDNDAYLYDSWDVNAHYEPQEKGNGKKPGMIFLSALPKGSPRESDIAVTALANLSQDEFQKLGGEYQIPGKREYNRTKNDLARSIINRIEQTFPGTREAVEIVDTYSPFTFERYTLTPGGTAYGIKKSAQAFLQGMFSPATRVKGLFLTGQSVGFCGIHGAISTSFNLCRNFYPGSYLMDKVRMVDNIYLKNKIRNYSKGSGRK